MRLLLDLRVKGYIPVDSSLSKEEVLGIIKDFENKLSKAKVSRDFDDVFEVELFEEVVDADAKLTLED